MATYPDYRGNACAAFSDIDKERLWSAAKTLADSGNPATRIAALLGEGVGWVGGKAAEAGAKLFGEGWEERVKEVAEAAPWRAHDLATVGLDPEGDRVPWDWFNKAVTSASGTVSGLFGLPGALIDVPISTLVMMRSIAEIARANGEASTEYNTRGTATLAIPAHGWRGSPDRSKQPSN